MSVPDLNAKVSLGRNIVSLINEVAELISKSRKSNRVVAEHLMAKIAQQNSIFNEIAKSYFQYIADLDHVLTNTIEGPDEKFAAALESFAKRKDDISYTRSTLFGEANGTYGEILKRDDLSDEIRSLVWLYMSYTNAIEKFFMYHPGASSVRADIIYAISKFYTEDDPPLVVEKTRELEVCRVVRDAKRHLISARERVAALYAEIETKAALVR